MTNEDDSKDLKDDNKQDSRKSMLAKAIKDCISNYAADKAGDLLNELLAGNFKDAMLDVYRHKKANDMSEDQLKAALEELKSSTQYKRDKEYADLDKRKDTNTKTDIDETSVKLWMMWKSKDQESDVAKTINEIVAEFQKQAAEVQKQKEQLAEKLKEMNIGITDEEFNKFGPALQKVVDEGKPEDVKKKLESLRKQLDEAFDMMHKRKYVSDIMLNEGWHFLMEDEQESALIDALLECKDYAECFDNMMLNEGLFSALKGGWRKLKELGGKTIKMITKGAIGPMLSLAGLAVSVFTGGWAAAGVIRLMYILERQGKKLKNGFERAWTVYANSKGAIAKMDFSIEGLKDTKYAARFYEKDMVWRVLNLSDQLKHPSSDFIKKILESDEGKRFRNVLQKTWDPLFSSTKGGKIDIKSLLQQSKTIDIPEKYIDLYVKFADNYDEIKANCIESPKIDTRTQSLKSSS